MSLDIRQEVTGSQNVTQIGVQNLHLIPVRRAWKRPAEKDSLNRWQDAVGRRADLDALRVRLTHDSSAAITAAVAGMAGVGKSTLASMFVHEHGAAYSGGVLWADLGYAFRSGDRCRAVLERWACYAYEGDPQFITQTLRENRLQLEPEAVRALLSGHGPLLAVLDDVWDAAAVEPLRRALPPDARLLITTRDTRIAEEFGLQPLDVLTPDDALALLRQELADLPADLLKRLAEGLGYHAQALRIAARDVKRRGDRPRREKAIADLLARVQTGEGFGDLPPLDQANRQSAVEAALKFSYDDVGAQMGPDYQRRFRFLGAFAPPEADFGTDAAAALWGDEPDAAAEFLDVLRDRALLTQTAEGRWTQHALLRAYALALLKRAEEEAVARGLHLEFYRAQVDYWIDERHEFAPLEPDLAQYRHAFAWARDHAPAALVAFVISGSQFLLLADHHDVLREWLDAALAIASERDDHLDQANTLSSLGDLSLRQDDLSAARGYYDRALTLFDQINDRLGQANTLKALGDWHQEQEQWLQALDYYERALAVFTAIEDTYSLAVTRRRMWPTLVALSRLEEAIRGILFAREVYLRIGLPGYAEYAHQSMRAVRDRVGAEAFGAAWQAVVGEPLPDWLKE